MVQMFPQEMYYAVKSFTMKLYLLLKQVKQRTFTHFQIIKCLPADAKFSHKYSTELLALRNGLDRRFADSRILDNKFDLIAAIFSFYVVNLLTIAKWN